MKKLIAAITTILITATTASAEITIINPGSAQGTFRQVLNTIGETVEHRFVQANNPVTAYSHMQNDAGPILTMWSSEWPGNSKLISPKITAGNLIALMTYETMICSRHYTSLEDMQGKTVKIATWGSESVSRFLTNLGQRLDISFKIVPFDGSGSTTKGYIAGDANTVFTITTRKSAIEEDSATNCIAFSTKGDLKCRFVDAIITINANKVTVDNFRNIVTELSSITAWQDKFNGSTTRVGGSNIDIFNEAVINFSN